MRHRASLLRRAGLVLACIGAWQAGQMLPATAASVRVVRGDTLTGLAARYHTTVAALTATNHLHDPDHIEAGTLLVVPATADETVAASGSLVVAPGDTLSAIAGRTGVSVAALAAANGLTDPDLVLAGAHLIIPASMALASAVIPDGAAPASPPAGGGLPTGLLAHPDRLALRPVFDHWAAVDQVPTGLLQAMCWWESGWQRTVVSSTGAIGIGQLEPATVRFVRTDLLADTRLDPSSASDNIEMAGAYLHWLLVRTGGRPDLALAGYYQGLQSVQRYGMGAATRQYVDGILSYAIIFAR